jgi:uncharacterized protein
MRTNKSKYCLSLGVLCLAISTSGCISIPNSPTPRIYALSAISNDQASKEIGVSSDAIIGVGPVKIPEYLDRPQMVTINKEKMIKVNELDRWAESLDLGMARLIREDLTIMLPGAKLTMYPWNLMIAVKYQVVVEVIQLDSELDRGMFLAVQWTVIDLQNSKTVMIKRSEFHRPIVPQNYSGLAQTLSSECASLSSQIAGALAGLNTKEVKEK